MSDPHPHPERTDVRSKQVCWRGHRWQVAYLTYLLSYLLTYLLTYYLTYLLTYLQACWRGHRWRSQVAYRPDASTVSRLPPSRNAPPAIAPLPLPYTSEAGPRYMTSAPVPVDSHSTRPLAQRSVPLGSVREQ